EEKCRGESNLAPTRGAPGIAGAPIRAGVCGTAYSTEGGNMAGEEIRVRPDGHNFTVELLAEGEAVSSLEVINLVMRIGHCPVRMGGIGGVGTNDKHRNKGYARRVLEYSTQWMAENGFDCATLFGIGDFYDKFGYAACLPDGRVEVATRDAERALPTLA